MSKNYNQAPFLIRTVFWQRWAVTTINEGSYNSLQVLMVIKLHSTICSKGKFIVNFGPIDLMG